MKIDKNIEYPKVLNARKALNKYPWDRMEVGDSFLVHGYSNSKQGSIWSAGSTWAKRNNLNWKFSTRKEGDGIRVFRIE